MKLFTVLLLMTCLAFAQSSKDSGLAKRPGNPRVAQDRVTREVRHELAMLPYYTIFDDLEYQVNGDTVTLLGEVTNPTLKDDAGRAVKRVEGVSQVKNNIEVLPLSPMDDQIRHQVARRIFGTDGLEKYAMSALPAIHVIVKNGHVTLKGIVDSAMDKQLAYTAANGVPNVFSVENELNVAGLATSAKK